MHLERVGMASLILIYRINQLLLQSTFRITYDYGSPTSNDGFSCLLFHEFQFHDGRSCCLSFFVISEQYKSLNQTCYIYIHIYIISFNISQNREGASSWNHYTWRIRTHLPLSSADLATQMPCSRFNSRTITFDVLLFALIDCGRMPHLYVGELY